MNEPRTPDVRDPETLRQTARDVRMRLLARISVMHAGGGLVVFGFIQLRYPASEAYATPWINDWLLVLATEAVLAPVAWGWVAHEFRRSSGWALAGRSPDDGERERLLAAPFHLAVRPLLFWLLAAVVIGGGVRFRRVLGLVEIFDIAQILVMGGIATCAISYLVIERTFRPLFACALSDATIDRPRTLGVRARLLLAWAASSGVPLLGLALMPFREAAASNAALLALGLVGLVAGLFAVSVAADSIAVRLDGIRAALARVAAGDISEDLEVDDGGEVGQLQAGFNQMVHGLRERQELQDLFGRHVGHEVAAQAMERGSDLGGEASEASAFFVDLIGSTAMAEVLPPSEVVSTLNAFFEAVVDEVSAEGGWVNKFQGDGALCVFGVPGHEPDHPARALRAARALRDRLISLSLEHPGLHAGIGVSCGTVVAGNVGSEERFEYTVIGRAVNEAARLTELAKSRPGRALAAASAVHAAGPEGANWTARGTVGLRGQRTPTQVYEIGTGVRSLRA
jgi:class 3 adenylate cyclase